MLRLGLLALAALAAPAALAQERELSTDRPDKTESPYTVPAGRFQVELDFVTYTIDRAAGVRAETVNVLPVNVKAGLDADTDLQIIFDSYIHQSINDRVAGTRRELDGIGDLTVRLKRNLLGNDGGKAALAIMPFVKLPTNSGGLGNDAVEGGIIVPLAIAIGQGVGLGLMTEIDLLRDEDGAGYSPSFVNTATIGFDLTERLGLYTEIFTERSAERGADWVVTFDAGLTYAISDDIQIDAGANLGLTQAADDIALFVGLSRRF